MLLLLWSCTQDYELVEPVDVDPGEVTDCDFTQVADATDFYAYDCNPVFTTSGEDWAPDVGSTAFNVTNVMGHPFYQMWYVGNEGLDGSWGVGYAVSSNGTDWEPYAGNPLWTAPDNQGWNHTNIDGLQVVWDPDVETYMMLYQGYNIPKSIWLMGVSTSPDGVNWDHYDPPDALSADTWCWPLGLELGPITGYSGYIAGNTGSNNQGLPSCEVFQLDGGGPDNWQASSVKVLGLGAQGQWDDSGVASMDIAWLGDTAYLFYVGFGDWNNFGTYVSAKDVYLGWAVSSDGSNWEKAGIIPLNNPDRPGEVSAVNAHTVGKRIHIWLTDQYDEGTGVGLFLFDPTRVEGEGE